MAKSEDISDSANHSFNPASQNASSEATSTSVNQSSKSCIHSETDDPAVDFCAVRKKLARDGQSAIRCGLCWEENVHEPDTSLCLCMKCGILFCSKHIRDHRNDFLANHDIFLNLIDKRARCFQCDVDIVPSNSVKMKEIVSYLETEKPRLFIQPLMGQITAADQSSKSCIHIDKAVNFSVVRKKILNDIGSNHAISCVNCSAKKNISESDNLPCICMQCGTYCCTYHIYNHYNTPRSDPHNIFVNLQDQIIRCCSCNADLEKNSSDKLKEAVTFLLSKAPKFVRPSPTVHVPAVLPLPYVDISSSIVFANSSSSTVNNGSKTLVLKSNSGTNSPRGLRNLGNTCFFNSVLQCLGRTPFLLNILQELREPSEPVTLQTVKCDPITVKLECSSGPVTENLINTLMLLTSENSSDAISPAHLLDALRKKHCQFLGYNQHDSHELLRTLLDSVKTEDIRRYHTEIIRHFGLKKIKYEDNAERAEQERASAIARELHKKLTEIVNIMPDPIFRGITVSANQCTICKHKSEIPESFLDLSLPVAFFKAPEISRKKIDSEEKYLSKHQQKKAAKKNKKMARMKRRAESNTKTGSTGISKKTNNAVDFVIDGNRDGSRSPSINTNVEKSSDVSQTATEEFEMLIESNDISLKELSREKSTSNNIDCATDDRLEININDGGSPNTINDEMKNSNSSEDDREDASSDSSASVDMEQYNNSSLQCATLQPLSGFQEDNSVQACLREYTKCELLTENNKVECEKCAKDHLKKTGEKNTIYRIFTKQLLIKSPPPVLILHLKRFETRGPFSFRKVDSFISFPFILDIGSFCTSTCDNLFYPEQKNVLYSLYGIVEHSGSLNGGHYVSYIKVRKMPEKGSYRCSFLPKGMKLSHTNLSLPLNEEDKTRILNEQSEEKCQWYYISDSSVRTVSQKDVLRAQAYLLFYERIW